jgi:hypothetical protein
VLFVSIILMVTGYTMLYSALHGKWEFWRFWFPNRAPSNAAASAAPAAAAV